jgi:hypothetical protein
MSAQNQWVDPDDVRASIGDFVDDVGREPLTARMSHGTWQITREGRKYRVECFGSGGGWYATRKMSRRALVNYLESQDQLELQRPESQRP